MLLNGQFSNSYQHLNNLYHLVLTCTKYDVLFWHFEPQHALKLSTILHRSSNLKSFRNLEISACSFLFHMWRWENYHTLTEIDTYSSIFSTVSNSRPSLSLFSIVLNLSAIWKWNLSANRFKPVLNKRVRDDLLIGTSDILNIKIHLFFHLIWFS